MATRMILKNGDPQLRKHCHEVKDFNPRLHMLLDDMRQTLAESNGVGLAAPQSACCAAPSSCSRRTSRTGKRSI